MLVNINITIRKEHLKKLIIAKIGLLEALSWLVQMKLVCLTFSWNMFCGFSILVAGFGLGLFCLVLVFGILVVVGIRYFVVVGILTNYLRN